MTDSGKILDLKDFRHADGYHDLIRDIAQGAAGLKGSADDFHFFLSNIAEPHSFNVSRILYDMKEHPGIERRMQEWIVAGALAHPDAHLIFKKLAVEIRDRSDTMLYGKVAEEEYRSHLRSIGIPFYKLVFQKRWLRESLDLNIFQCRTREVFFKRAREIYQSGKVHGTAKELESTLKQAILASVCYGTSETREAGKVVYAAAKAHPEGKQILKAIEDYCKNALRREEYESALHSFKPPLLPQFNPAFRRSGFLAKIIEPLKSRTFSYAGKA